MKLTESKLRSIIQEEMQRLNELDAMAFKTLRNGLNGRGVGGGIANFTNDTGRRNLVRVDFKNGETVMFRGVLSNKVKIIYGDQERTVRMGKGAASNVVDNVEQMLQGTSPSDFEQPIGKSMR
jgi:hypothetical protein